VTELAELRLPLRAATQRVRQSQRRALKSLCGPGILVPWRWIVPFISGRQNPEAPRVTKAPSRKDRNHGRGQGMCGWSGSANPLDFSLLRQRVQMSNSRSHVLTSPPASSMRHPLVVQ
jgi:hypothetical protein